MQLGGCFVGKHEGSSIVVYSDNGVYELIRGHLDVHWIDGIRRGVGFHWCTIKSGNGSLVQAISLVELVGTKRI